MANETVARRYADAVFQLAAQDSQRIGRDLHVLRDAIYDDPSVMRFFMSPVVDRKEKERSILAAFSGRVHEIALHTVLLLVRKRREQLLSEIVAQYDALQMTARGAEPLTVTSARPLSGEQLREIIGRLERLYGKKFEVEQRVDASLIGGVRILMGDRRIDGSVEGRLQDLSRTLFAQTS